MHPLLKLHCPVKTAVAPITGFLVREVKAIWDQLQINTLQWPWWACFPPQGHWPWGSNSSVDKALPQTERWLLALERRSSFEGAALTAAMTSPRQISASTKCSSTLGSRDASPPTESKSNKAGARGEPCDTGVSLHRLLFLSSTCAAPDLERSFASCIQGAFKEKWDLQSSPSLQS